MEKRKGFQWYKTLTKKQQKQFRLNCHRCAIYNGVRNFQRALNETNYFFKFIDNDFIWELSPQGYQYWEDIATSKD